MEASDLSAIQLRLRSAWIVETTYLIEVDGELDLFSAPELLRCIQHALDEGGRTVIVDLRRTPFMDSTGLGVLVAGTKRARRGGGDLHVVGSRPSIASILDTAGVDAYLSILPTVANALELQ